jgi:hypothetical protein
VVDAGSQEDGFIGWDGGGLTCWVLGGRDWGKWCWDHFWDFWGRGFAESVERPATESRVLRGLRYWGK